MKKIVKRFSTLVIAFSFLVSVSGCSAKDTPKSSSLEPTNTPAAQESVANIAIVFNQLGDLSMNDMGHDGIKRAHEELGITFDYVECPSETETETQLRLLAGSGTYNLIITMGANRLEAVTGVAKEFPDQRFSLIDSAVADDISNLRGSIVSFPQTTFLSGVLAGLVTNDERMPMANKENVIGFAGGMDSPTSKAGAAGFFAGIKYVNPDCEILYTIVGSYNDPGKAKEIALTSIGRGADIMSVNCGASATGVLEAVQEKNVYFIGSSYGILDKEHSLGTTFTAYENLVYQEVEAIVKDTWKSGTITKGIADGACNCSFEGVEIDIPDDIIAKIEQARQDVIDGKVTLPDNPDMIDEWAKSNTLSK